MATLMIDGNQTDSESFGKIRNNQLTFEPLKTTIPALVNLPKFLDVRGNLSFIEEETHLPFKIRRVYWIYDVPGGEHRGGHAFREYRRVNSSTFRKF